MCTKFEPPWSIPGVRPVERYCAEVTCLKKNMYFLISTATNSLHDYIGLKKIITSAVDSDINIASD